MYVTASFALQPYVTDNDNYIIDLKFEKPTADADQVYIHYYCYYN